MILNYTEKKQVLYACYELYGEAFEQHMNRQREVAPIYDIGDAHVKWFERRYRHMLNFKNEQGEIVMTESDKGALTIHDETLKESLEKQISLEEAKKVKKNESI